MREGVEWKEVSLSAFEDENRANKSLCQKYETSSLAAKLRQLRNNSYQKPPSSTSIGNDFIPRRLYLENILNNIDEY